MKKDPADAVIVLDPALGLHVGAKDRHTAPSEEEDARDHDLQADERDDDPEADRRRAGKRANLLAKR